MSDKKINIAVVGLGFGAEFIPIWQRHPLTNCHAICQRDPKKLQAIGDAFEIEKRYTDFKAMLQDPEIDAVHINSAMFVAIGTVQATCLPAFSASMLIQP